MRLSTRMLLIVGNPFAAPLSAEGRCTALCAVDPNEPMGASYIGAKTVAKRDPSRRSMLAVGGKTLGRDKVSVVYELTPVRVADTAYYRNAIRAGDAIEAADWMLGSVGWPKSIQTLHSAARARLMAFVAEGGDRAAALAAWREQGLAAVANAIDPPNPDAAPLTPRNVEPASAGEGAVS